MMAKQKAQAATKSGLTHNQQFELEMRRVDVDQTKVRMWGGFWLLVGFALVVVTSIPIAQAFAGKNTAINLTITLSLSISLAGVASIVSIISHRRRKRIERLQQRNRVLAEAIHQLQKRLRQNDLNATITPEAQAAAEDPGMVHR